MEAYPGNKAFPIPLRKDLTVHFAPIPLDLTKAEAEKICRIIMALAND